MLRKNVILHMENEGIIVKLLMDKENKNEQNLKLIQSRLFDNFNEIINNSKLNKVSNVNKDKLKNIIVNNILVNLITDMQIESSIEKEHKNFLNENNPNSSNSNISDFILEEIENVHRNTFDTISIYINNKKEIIFGDFSPTEDKVFEKISGDIQKEYYQILINEKIINNISKINNLQLVNGSSALEIELEITLEKFDEVPNEEKLKIISEITKENQNLIPAIKKRFEKVLNDTVKEISKNHSENFKNQTKKNYDQMDMGV